MAAEPREQPMSLEEFAAHAAEVYERLERDGGSVLVGQGDVLFTVRPKRHRRKRQLPRHITADDPLWSIIGIADSGEPGNDVASNKYKYVAEAIASDKGNTTENIAHPPTDTSVLLSGEESSVNGSSES